MATALGGGSLQFEAAEGRIKRRRSHMQRGAVGMLASTRWKRKTKKHGVPGPRTELLQRYCK